MTDKTQPEALPRYKIGYPSDGWGVISHTPTGIPDPQGAWVRYGDAQKLNSRIAELEAQIEAVGAGGEQPLQATPAKESTADVKAKIQSNTWDHFGDILPTLKAISRGDWYWGANSRCKYIEIRIDTRDGGCILYDRDRVRISPEQLAHQSHSVGRMGGWTAQIAAAPQAAPAVDAARLEFVLAHGLPTEAGGYYRCDGFSDQGWHKTKADAIDAAMAAQGYIAPTKRGNFDACDMATAAAQGFRDGLSAKEKEL